MNRQKKQFIVICVLLVIVIIVYVAAVLFGKWKTKQQEAEDEANTIYLAQIAADDVIAFSYTLNDEILTFERSGDNWIYLGDNTIDIDEDQIADMLETTESLAAVSVLTTDEYDTDNLDGFGLAEPSSTISITTDDGTTTFYVGGYNATTYYYYVMKDGDDRIFLLDSNLASSFSTSIDDLTVVPDDTETEEPEETEESEELTED